VFPVVSEPAITSVIASSRSCWLVMPAPVSSSRAEIMIDIRSPWSVPPARYLSMMPASIVPRRRLAASNRRLDRVGTQARAGMLATIPSGSSSVSSKSAAAELAGSPPPLAAIHAQASRILPGGQNALDARIKKLRSEGYAVVLNIWASWCQPCQAEFGLFGRASALYGKDVAFLGADSQDNVADAQAFLRSHHVSYPSYETTPSSIEHILKGGLQGTPTTVFISPLGGMFVHPYNYTSLGALEADIQSHALGSAG